ncbi:unnamed protein product [Amaranthus hypochondriacus]
MGRFSSNDKMLLVQALRKGGDVVVVSDAAAELAVSRLSLLVLLHAFVVNEVVYDPDFDRVLMSQKFEGNPLGIVAITYKCTRKRLSV